MGVEAVQNSLVIKTKIVLIEQIDKKIFQLSYQNKSCLECQQDVRKIERQANRETGRKKEILFSLVIKTKVVKNVNKKDKTESHQARIAGQLKTSLLFLHHCHLYL